ncbi:MAG: DUF485 domain-containing protein [Arcobacteraceae bacterium]|jgi:uncharacterized membrane protein (DUF485 family)|nr:DUF485 domain-containing protein [Arcobacteraceae bacterium]MDY0364257.1 DUF485 domain-containing protein [Arcobacteraceae bacterium]
MGSTQANETISNSRVEFIKSIPEYQELVKRRNSFGNKLAILMLVIYYSFILVIAFDKELFGIPLSEGTTTTVGIVVGVCIIVVTFVLTGVYTFRANKEYDDLNNKIKEKVAKEESK